MLQRFFVETRKFALVAAYLCLFFLGSVRKGGAQQRRRRRRGRRAPFRRFPSSLLRSAMLRFPADEKRASHCNERSA